MRASRVHSQFWICLAIYTCAFAVRAAYLLVAPNWPIVGGDGAGYLSMAGDLTSFFPSLPPPGHSFWTIASITGPGCPIFLALVAWIANFRLPYDFTSILALAPPPATEWFWPFRWANCAIGAVTPVAAYVVGRYSAVRYGKWVGLIAAGLICINPTDILYVSYLVSETLGIALFWSGFAVMAYSRQRRSLTGVAFAGVIVGLACLTRVIVTYCAILLPLAIWFTIDGSKTRRLKAIAIFLTPILGLLVGWSALAVGHSTKPVLGSSAVESRWMTLANAVHPMQFPWIADRQLSLMAEIGDFRVTPNTKEAPRGADIVTYGQKSTDGSLWVFRVPHQVMGSLAGSRARVTIAAQTNSAHPVQIAVRYVADRQG